MADKIKIAIAAALLVAGIAAFYYWDQSPLIARVGAVIGGMVAGIVVFWTSAKKNLNKCKKRNHTSIII